MKLSRRNWSNNLSQLKMKIKWSGSISCKPADREPERHWLCLQANSGYSPIWPLLTESLHSTWWWPKMNSSREFAPQPFNWLLWKRSHRHLRKHGFISTSAGDSRSCSEATTGEIGRCTIYDCCWPYREISSDKCTVWADYVATPRPASRLSTPSTTAYWCCDSTHYM